MIWFFEQHLVLVNYFVLVTLLTHFYGDLSSLIVLYSRRRVLLRCLLQISISWNQFTIYLLVILLDIVLIECWPFDHWRNTFLNVFSLGCARQFAYARPLILETAGAHAMNWAVVLVKIFPSSGSLFASVIEYCICINAIVGFLSIKTITYFPWVVTLWLNSNIRAGSSSDKVVDAVPTTMQVVLLILTTINFATHFFKLIYFADLFGMLASMRTSH